jgi:hypothetical protein
MFDFRKSNGGVYAVKTWILISQWMFMFWRQGQKRRQTIQHFFEQHGNSWEDAKLSCEANKGLVVDGQDIDQQWSGFTHTLQVRKGQARVSKEICSNGMASRTSYRQGKARPRSAVCA